MTSKYYLLFLSLLITASPTFAQYRDKDHTNSYAKNIKSPKGKGYDLVFLTGNGKNDTVSVQADAIYKYNGLLMKPRFFAKKGADWFQLDQGKKPVLIPGHTYLGNGLFLDGEDPSCTVWSAEEQKVVLKGLDRDERNYPEQAPNENGSGFVSFYYTFESPGHDYTDLLGTAGYKDIRFGTYGLYTGNITWSYAKAGNKKLAGISLLTGDNDKPVTRPVYDDIARSVNFLIAKKGKVYDVYDAQLNLLVTSDKAPRPVLFKNLAQVSKGGKYGLINAYGREILPYQYDTIFLNGILSAVKNDSVFFFDDGKLIFKDVHVKGAVYDPTGSYEYPPLSITRTLTVPGVYDSKTLFTYNPFTKKLIELRAYEYVYRYDVNPVDYLLCGKKDGKIGIFEFYKGDQLPFEYEMIGQPVFDTRFDSIHPHIAKKNGKIGVLDRHLEELVPFEYDAYGHVAYVPAPQGDGFSLKKSGKSYLYHKTAGLSKVGYDSILLFPAYSPDNKYKNKAEIQAIEKGVRFLIDSTGRRYYDLTLLHVRKAGPNVVLEDTSLNQVPVVLAPLATINRVEEINKEHSYVIVFCLNRYFVINTYGEMSTGFEVYPEYIDTKRNLVFAKMLKSQKAPGLYTFKGTEKGKMSEAKMAYMEYDMITKEAYYLFTDKKGLKGLLNANGEVLLECKYADIGTIGREAAGKCEVWPGKNSEPQQIDLKSLKPVKQ